MDCESNSVMAATLANGGICPITEKRILKFDVVENVLNLMSSCGMGIFSGQFAFNVRYYLLLTIIVSHFVKCGFCPLK